MRKPTPKQILVAHITEEHESIGTYRATLAELQRMHARRHHQFYTGHYHDPAKRPDPTKPPGSSNRPNGWRTGEDAIPKPAGLR